MDALAIPLTEKTRSKISSYIENELGIRMPPIKRDFLRARLSKRLNSLSLNSFKDYFDLLKTPEGQVKELPKFVDAVTTNKTDFFREVEHYHYLLESLIPVLAGQGSIRIWSSACSTGEEPYTLAMLLENYKTKNLVNFDYQIFANTK